MFHNTWKNGAVVEGQWRAGEPEEFNEVVQYAIVVLSGIMDANWAVVPSLNSKIWLFRQMELSNDNLTWVFEAELSRLEP